MANEFDMTVTPLFRPRGFVSVLAVVFAAFVGIQFIRPELGNPPVTANFNAPRPVVQILRTACYNCHSSETKLAWFDQIAPAYWLVASHVKAGRSHLNFSEIGSLPVSQHSPPSFDACASRSYAGRNFGQYI
jgi:hypothetical protein